MKKLTKIAMLLLALGAGVISFTGCKTAEGFGEDVEKAGEEIQDSVK